MPRFTGLSDDQWALLEPLMPKPPVRKKAGFPRNPWRNVLNSVLWMLLTGARWCDLPKESAFASRTASNRWLIRWRHDGTLDKLFKGLRELAHLSGQIDWQRLSVDGSFSPVQRPRKRRNLRPQGQGHDDASGGRQARATAGREGDARKRQRTQASDAHAEGAKTAKTQRVGG